MKENDKRYKIMYSTYLFICFIGFIWQVILSSESYFSFDVVSSVIYDDPTIDKSHAINICFPKFNLLDSSRAGCDYNLANTAHDILNCSLDWDSITSRATMNGFQNLSSKFYIGDFICYRFVKNSKNTKRKFVRDPIAFMAVSVNHDLKNIKVFMNQINKLPYLEMINSKYVKSNITRLISAYSIRIIKIKWPYQDNCFKYHKLGYIDKSDAINTCVDRFLNKAKNKSSRYKIWRLGDQSLPLDYLNNNFSEYFKLCENQIKHPDCDLEITYSKLSEIQKITLDRYSNSLVLDYSISDIPSFVIKSNPKVIFVDYLNLMLGALGSWLGLSILSLNPITTFCGTKKGTTSNNVDPNINLMNLLSVQSQNNQTHVNLILTRLSKIENVVNHQDEK